MILSVLYLTLEFKDMFLFKFKMFFSSFLAFKAQYLELAHFKISQWKWLGFVTMSLSPNQGNQSKTEISANPNAIRMA